MTTGWTAWGAGHATLATLIVPFLIYACPYRTGAQVRVPSVTSFEVHVPVAPIPVRIGGRSHLAYELHITNFRTVDLTLTRIDVRGDEPNGAPLTSYADADLHAGLALPGRSTDTSDKRVFGPGVRAVFFVWLGLEDGATAPSRLHHRLSFNGPGPSGGEAGVVDSAHVAVREESPIVLEAPLRDGPWVAVYDPSAARGHRRALFAIDGKARIPARFAIDWIRLGDNDRPSSGDASRLENFHGYGAEVLAVADAVVVDAVDKHPEPTRPVTLDNAGGNYLTIDLGGGRFAFYEHLKPGSVNVKVGDRVRRGQVLARLGASGSVSSGPHLHFHLGDTNSPLGAEGIPFVFRSFEALGAFASLEALASGKPWLRSPTPATRARRDEMPLHQTVVRF